MYSINPTPSCMMRCDVSVKHINLNKMCEDRNKWLDLYRKHKDSNGSSVTDQSIR